jgi:hypothetical protein
LKIRDHSENLGVDGRIILKLIFRNNIGSVDWINLALDRGKRPVVTKAVMNFRVP